MLAFATGGHVGGVPCDRVPDGSARPAVPPPGGFVPITPSVRGEARKRLLPGHGDEEWVRRA